MLNLCPLDALKWNKTLVLNRSIYNKSRVFDRKCMSQE